MAHLSGLLLIDAPASALNNAGKSEDARTENAIAVKRISTREGIYPYVSAQALRYWWREALREIPGWTPSPIFREGKVAYTDANPIAYAEDDLFGYMRAPSKKEDAKKQREEQGTLAHATPLEEGVTLTRSAPLKVSTLVSIAPLREVTTDFGVMARHEGDPVPFEHEFYRTTLQGLFSADLRMMGRFYHVHRTGYKHLDEVRVAQAKAGKLSEYDSEKAYELPLSERHQRLARLLHGLARLTGGAKLALHYTDVTPRLLMMAVGKGGNHLMATAVGADPKGLPVIKVDALKETMRVYKDDLLSGLYVGLAQGYLDGQRGTLREALTEIEGDPQYGHRKTFLGHPREAIDEFLKDLAREYASWLA